MFLTLNLSQSTFRRPATVCAPFCNNRHSLSTLNLQYTWCIGTYKVRKDAHGCFIRQTIEPGNDHANKAGGCCESLYTGFVGRPRDGNILLSLFAVALVRGD